jgi:hypothetical protein
MNEHTSAQDENFPPGIGLSGSHLKPVPGESMESYEAFVCYFNLGTNRTLKQVSQKLELALSTLKVWSSKHHWADRIMAYTAHAFQNCLESQKQQSTAQLTAKTELEKQQKERCANLASFCSNLGENVLKHIILTNPDQFKTLDGIRLVELGNKLACSARAGVNLDDLQDADQLALKNSLQEAINWVAQQKMSAATSQTSPAAQPPSTAQN